MSSRARVITIFLPFMLALALLAPVALAKTCDIDVNGAIDQKDISLIMAANGKSASGSTDPRDADGDGKITVLDARKCTLQCSRPKCAINTAPVANNDNYTVTENTVWAVVFPGVLLNDTDAQGDTLTATLISPPASGTLTLNANGSFSYTPATDFNGNVTFTYRANDNLADSNIATVTIKVMPVLPPDPVTVAPPLDRTISTSVFTATEFLYTGANPIQTGVASGTIEPRRVAVLRGKVQGRDGVGLSAVRISVLDHPEFGQTLSRADGMFDIAVNGGGLLTITYQKSGLISAQRQVNAPWRDYVMVPDVMLIQLDNRVTAIDLTNTATVQVARGNPMTDADGTRQATLFFPAGTQATMTLANGSMTNLTNFHVRATEFTVGPDGPKMMPADLPPSSGYTYEVEYSVDEAEGAGATRVSFNPPLISYTENFIGFPVGTLVPYGEYDRKKGMWIARENGRVIKILSIAQGLATLDLDGSGQAASAAALAALGISAEELQKLAALYPSGQSLWRVPIEYFLVIN